MVDVFISYPRAERERVEPIRERLEALDLDVFFDLDGIDGGANFPDVIDRALRASKSVLACWSPLYFTRPWCMIECRDALDRNLLVPSAVQGFDKMDAPADLRQVNYFDLTDWDGADAHEDWNRTLRSLGQKIGRELAPELSRGWFGGLKAGAAPAAPAPAAAKADLLEDLRRTWAGFPAQEDLAAVERFLERVRAAAPGSGLEFEIEHHLDILKRQIEAERLRAAAITGKAPPGTIFRDALKSGGEGPEMCVIPAGRFLMGSPADEPQRSSDEGPQHEVTIARPFALGRVAVTFDEYDAFCAATDAEKPSDVGWGRGRRPAIKLSWEDAQAYCIWLSELTGAEYRLPTEAEWEYACRAGTTTPFWWGREITPDRANYNGNRVYAGGGAKGAHRQKTEPVDAFDPNPWGLYQTHGNVWEWCQDCWNDSYQGAPIDGSARMSGDFSRAVLRGGSWGYFPGNLRSASRSRVLRGYRTDGFGFRLARTLRE